MSGAITASTLTTICVFFPIVFVDGFTREIFTDMALTITYSLFASLFIALTVVPMDTIRKCAVRIVAVRGKKKRAAG